MKRAQMEIMGLAIIVVLLLIGMTFVLRFMINKEPTDIALSFRNTELSSNTINTMLKTNHPACSDLSTTELIQDCATQLAVPCFESGTAYTSCQWVEKTAAEIFLETLEEWNIDYEFKIYEAEANPEIVLGSPCLGNRKSKLFPIPTLSGVTVTVRLDICG